MIGTPGIPWYCCDAYPAAPPASDSVTVRSSPPESGLLWEVHGAGSVTVNVVPAGPEVGLRVMGGGPDDVAPPATLPVSADAPTITNAADSTTSTRFFMMRCLLMMRCPPGRSGRRWSPAMRW